MSAQAANRAIEAGLSNSGDSAAPDRRVVLLKTDERSGLVASIAAACHAGGVSLEITTGLSHVLLTFAADSATADRTVEALAEVPGVAAVHSYTVMSDG